MRPVDVADLTTLLLAAIGTAAGCGLLIERRRPRWSMVQMAFVAALPVPLLVLLPCALIFVSATMASREQCGVDACGMAMTAAYYGSIAAMMAYLAGLVGSAATLWFVRAR